MFGWVEVGQVLMFGYFFGTGLIVGEVFRGRRFFTVRSCVAGAAFATFYLVIWWDQWVTIIPNGLLLAAFILWGRKAHHQARLRAQWGLPPA